MALPKIKYFAWPEVTIKFFEPSTVEIFHKPTKETFYSGHRGKSTDWNLKRCVESVDLYCKELSVEGMV